MNRESIREGSPDLSELNFQSEEINFCKSILIMLSKATILNLCFQLLALLMAIQKVMEWQLTWKQNTGKLFLVLVILFVLPL